MIEPSLNSLGQIVTTVVAKLQEHLPEDIRIWVVDDEASTLTVDSNTGAAVSFETSVASQLLTQDEHIRMVVTAVLDNVQDWVARTTMEPWPTATGPMPMPHVVVGDGTVVAWYGEENAPSFPMIRVALHAGDR
jgi:hypothetical protein